MSNKSKKPSCTFARTDSRYKADQSSPICEESDEDCTIEVDSESEEIKRGSSPGINEALARLLPDSHEAIPNFVIDDLQIKYLEDQLSEKKEEISNLKLKIEGLERKNADLKQRTLMQDGFLANLGHQVRGYSDDSRRWEHLSKLIAHKLDGVGNLVDLINWVLLYGVGLVDMPALPGAGNEAQMAVDK
ncbi:hypothetical protein V5O48_009440 [Marasmius crinis-equi]|uniref:Uncharacterized protein n=1 Tax=Marasmius crinis-equi TaxID=585013 RepID=A0ABR3FB39_9AGAR